MLINRFEIRPTCSSSPFGQQREETLASLSKIYYTFSIQFAPYIDGYHWQLLVIIPRQCTTVWFCSCHRKIPPALKNMLQEIVGKPRGQQLKVLYPNV
ncbi:hypothetical protein DEO72_LG10g3794 [Vigna unguiculata]|uniref:Ubiquitin-like protease family profile domain-containing protein n=1 Tax=Vigna unguiculata TaxID=3917 RepID=A0A4D6NIW4_VIGUN|nr:hypothetical protein DEO72_LG10g3794 [Vigna unguiculata]